MAPRSVSQASSAPARLQSSRAVSRPRARRRLIFALDVASLKEVDRYVALLADEVGLFKVGKQLFVHAGPEVIRRIQAKGGTVFSTLNSTTFPRQWLPLQWKPPVWG